MIQLIQYLDEYISPDVFTQQIESNAGELVDRVNKMMANMEKSDVHFYINVATHCQLAKADSTLDIGDRRQTDMLQIYRQLRLGQGLFLHDRFGKIDKFINKHEELLYDYQLWRLHPSFTPDTCYLTIQEPMNESRTFIPQP